MDFKKCHIFIVVLYVELHLPLCPGHRDNLRVPAYLHHPQDGPRHPLPPLLRPHHLRTDGRAESQDFLFCE